MLVYYLFSLLFVLMILLEINIPFTHLELTLDIVGLNNFSFYRRGLGMVAGDHAVALAFQAVQFFSVNFELNVNHLVFLFELSQAVGVVYRECKSLFQLAFKNDESLLQQKRIVS